jgi:hypothetical protein
MRYVYSSITLQSIQCLWPDNTPLLRVSGRKHHIVVTRRLLLLCILHCSHFNGKHNNYST